VDVIVPLLWVGFAGLWVAFVLAIPVALLALVVLGVRALVGARGFAPHDPRWISVYDVAAGVMLMLAAASPVARIGGAILAVGAAGAGTLEVERVRALLYAFLAGLALLLAPAVTVAVGISAGWRWFERA
jgi:hypothetical protein